MRRAITELVSRYGIDHQSLQHRFVLEIIGEARCDFAKSVHLKNAQSFTEEAYRIIEGIEVEAAQRGELFNGTKELLTALKESFYSGRNYYQKLLPKLFIPYFRTFHPIVRSSSAVMM